MRQRGFDAVRLGPALQILYDKGELLVDDSDLGREGFLFTLVQVLAQRLHDIVLSGNQDLAQLGQLLETEIHFLGNVFMKKMPLCRNYSCDRIVNSHI